MAAFRFLFARSDARLANALPAFKAYASFSRPVLGCIEADFADELNAHFAVIVKLLLYKYITENYLHIILAFAKSHDAFAVLCKFIFYIVTIRDGNHFLQNRHMSMGFLRTSQSVRGSNENESINALIF